MELLTQVLTSGEDVFTTRQRGRQVAAALGFDDADQVRIATAISELSRDVVLEPGGGRAELALTDDRAALVITIVGVPADVAASEALAAARRLMSDVVVSTSPTSPSPAVSMVRRLPWPLPADVVAGVHERIVAAATVSPLDELRLQNRELLTTLEALEARQAELVELNAELQQTNQGVMALYAQLSAEMESTNTGVVALYAELDEKSRQLQTANEAKNRFMTGISHELRSPVTSTLGLVELLLDPFSPPLTPEQRHQVATIGSTAADLLELINQLLDLAKAESGKLEPRRETTDVGVLVGQVVATARPLLFPDVELRVELPEPPIEIVTDPALVRQIVRNLLSNAASFTEHGTIAVKVGPTPTTVTITVQDSGVGISREHHDRIFEEFFQVRGPLQQGRRASGLGLPYSRKIAALIHGALSVDSTPGEGSAFVLTLPRTAAHEASAP
jgi:signal transduction histidine kinase